MAPMDAVPVASPGGGDGIGLRRVLPQGVMSYFPNPNLL